MKLDTTRPAETPEGLSLVLRPAGVPARSLAYALDFFIRLVVFGIAASILAPLKAFGSGIAMLLYFGLEWLYPILFELLPGSATPGKRAMGLKVVMDTGLPVTVAGATVRNLLRAGDFLPFAFLVGILSMLLRSDFKRLGDLAAGTLVVHCDAPRAHGALPAARPAAPRLPLTREQQMAVMALAGRAARLTPDRVDELAAQAEVLLPPGDPEEAGARLLSVAQWLQGQRA